MQAIGGSCNINTTWMTNLWRALRAYCMQLADIKGTNPFEQVLIHEQNNTKTAMAVRNFNPAGHEPVAPTYSHISSVPISETKKLVTFAGQVGTASKATTFPQQCQNAIANVDKCLHATGARKSDIVSIRQYVVRLSQLSDEDRMEGRRILLTWWKETEGENLRPPGGTLMGLGLVTKETLYEIEVSCVVGV